MENNKSKGERLSFYKLFKEKHYRVLVPIIQRDYAQGRKNKKEIRDAFLDTLYKYLDENKPNRDLDFVYGSLDNNNFIPLDGQQRLTTLFLLHWYLYQLSDNKKLKKEFKENLVKNEKSMFTYETRASSSEFCDALMNAQINLSVLLPNDEGKENSLSKTIKNSAWYYLSWDHDPTIQGMLTMLDAIHKKFFCKKEFFERLLDIHNPIITFLFLNLEEFHLTDDLYIKMNSRGKPLTPFENFKARFEQYLEDIDEDELSGREFVRNGNTERKVSIRDYFAYNIDTKWADFFWQYRKLQNRSGSEMDNDFDDELMNFIRVIFTNEYAATLGLGAKEKDDTLEYLLGTQVAKRNPEYSDVISFYKYEKLNVLIPKDYEKFLSIQSKKLKNSVEEENDDKGKHKKLRENSVSYVIFLINALDEFSSGGEKIKNYLSSNYKFYYDENKIFENALRLDFKSYHERLMFHAYIGFLLKNKENRDGIDQWIRVIHNLSHPDNTIIDSATDFARAIASTEKLLGYSNNILDYLTDNDTNIDFFSSWQILEEKMKAHLILKDEKWKKEIEKTEKHKYFNGQIGFILEFAGILDYYINHKNCDWSDDENKEFFDKFSEYAEIAREVFAESYDKRINDKDYVFERAVLTKGDYLTEASQNRRNLLSTSTVRNNVKRDHSWKRLLRISDEEWLKPNDGQYNNEWTKRRLYVKQVFDDILGDQSNTTIVEKLDKIIKNSNVTDWRRYFIECPGLIEYCEQGFVRFENGNNKNNILLYRQSRSSHYHAEMRTYYLWKIWKKYIESNKDSYRPFKSEDIKYKEVMGIDNKPHILFKGFNNCEIKIFYDKEGYKIEFHLPEDENNQTENIVKIKGILKESGFECNGNCKIYIYLSKSDETEEKLVNKLIYILEKLKDLPNTIN